MLGPQPQVWILYVLRRSVCLWPGMVYEVWGYPPLLWPLFRGLVLSPVNHLTTWREDCRLVHSPGADELLRSSFSAAEINRLTSVSWNRKINWNVPTRRPNALETGVAGEKIAPEDWSASLFQAPGTLATAPVNRPLLSSVRVCTVHSVPTPVSDSDRLGVRGAY